MAVRQERTPTAVGPGDGRTIRFYDDEIEIKSRADGLDVFELAAHPGSEPPMHVHEREDETFYVLDGEVTFYAGEDVIEGTRGTFVRLARGVAHTYSVRSPMARLLVMASPSGFIDMFDAVQEAFGGEMPTTPAPEHGPILGAVLAEYGVEIVGPNPGA